MAENMKTLAFFNTKSRVGKTSLVYHLAWMYAELGVRVIAADLDPQSNLTSLFLEEERLEELWPETKHTQSIVGAISPVIEGAGDMADPHIEPISNEIGLIVGDLELAGIEDTFSSEWQRCLDRAAYSFEVVSAFHRLLEVAAAKHNADLILIDVGPNLGFINRAAMIAADFIAVPLAADLFAPQGLRTVGPSLRNWREQWGERLAKAPDLKYKLPAGNMQPIGYIATQQAFRQNRQTFARGWWTNRIPQVYRNAVLGENEEQTGSTKVATENDPHLLARLKYYPSLMPMALEAHKPMFLLKPADGAIGAHSGAVQHCYQDFRQLAVTLAERCGVELPAPLYR